MQLNQGQQAAVEAVYNFLLSPDKEFILSGPAGVGKTFLMKHIEKDVLQSYQSMCKLLGLPAIDYEVVLTATTNKAAEVLGTATGQFVSTIHSHMNLKVKDNTSTGDTEITRTNLWKVHGKQLLFIDEASMIDSKLHRYILEGTDASCKIVYIGDHCQMAPVFEPISPIYMQPKHFAVLTEPVRNVDQPALMALCNQLRDTVENGTFYPISEVPGVIDYLDDLGAQALINQTFQQENPESRILCYTNSQVQDYNQYIRELRGYPSLFLPGETLICNSAVQVGNTFLSVEQEVRVHKAETTTRKVSLDNQAELEVQDLTLTDPLNSFFLKTQVPANPEHHKNLMKFFAGQKNWKAYFNLKNSYPDLRQRDAATVYKAQGSTYDSVLIDLTNIGKCTQADQVARMLYVAASRARNRVYLYGKLPARFQ